MRAFAALIGLCLVIPVSGQDPEQQPPLYGFHGPRFGLGLATQSAGGYFENSSNLLPRPLFGWFIEAPLHPQMSLMPELLWMVKGAVVRNPAQNTRSRTTLNYLELPLSLKISTDKTPNGIYLLVGPSFGYFVSGNYKSWQGDDLVQDTQYDLSEDQKRFQFSGLLGIGSEGERWAVDARAQTSFTPFEPIVQVQNVIYALTFAYRIHSKPPEKDPDEELEP